MAERLGEQRGAPLGVPLEAQFGAPRAPPPAAPPEPPRGVVPEGRILDLARFADLKEDIQTEYRKIRSESFRGLVEDDKEPAVVGYIWSCAPLSACLSWLWPGRRRGASSRGLARAQEIRERTVKNRDEHLRSRWCKDAAAVDIQVATLGGATHNLRVGRDATAGDVKARLASIVGAPQSEIALVCCGHTLDDLAGLPAEALDGPPPQASMLRVRRHRALTGSHDGTLKFWDVSAGTSLGSMRGHGDAVISMAVDWASRRALTGSHDCTMKLWDLDHGRCVETLHAPGHPAFCLAVDWGAARALSGSWDCEVKAWDLQCSGGLGGFGGHAAPVTCVVLGWERRRAASGSADGVLKLWDPTSGGELWTVEAHALKITSLEADWGAQRLASGDDGGTVKVWDLKASTCLSSFQAHNRCIAGLSMHWETQRILTASWDGCLKAWKPGQDTCVLTLTHAPLAAVTCMQVDWAGQFVVSGCAKALTVWDLASGAELHKFAGHEDTISCVALESE